MNIAIVDLETTGTAPDSEILEIGSYLSAGGDPEQPFHSLVRPLGTIPPEAMAVHHIMDEDVENAPPWRDVGPAWLDTLGAVDAFCAHNASFEATFLKETIGEARWVCTFKCAMQAWPDAPGFGNQVLRYWRNPDGIVRKLANETHRALPDAYVTTFLLRELLKEHPLEKLLDWSADIAMPPRLLFGKHRGATWDEVPLDYIDWIVDKSELDADLKACAARHRKRRTIEPPFMLPPDSPPPAPTMTLVAYMGVAPMAIGMARSTEDLENWWRKEVDHRSRYGIRPGSVEYQRLVDLCTAQKRKIAYKPQAA